MAKLEWSDDFSVGVGQFDDEHKELIRLFNDLYDAMSQGLAKDKVPTIIGLLNDYTTSHFVHEEEAFIKYDYPNAEEHIKQHTEFREKLREIKQQLTDGNNTLGIPVFHLLISWIRNHIQKADRAYTAHFNSQGLQ
jgi:hemerythrin-like metal-binding protein